MRNVSSVAGWRVWPWLPLWLLLMVGASGAVAHEVRPSIVDLSLPQDGHYQLAIRLNLEAIIAEIGPEHGDTAASANAALYDRLRAQSPEQLQAAFDAQRRRFMSGILLRTTDRSLQPALIAVTIPPVGDTDLARDSVITLSGELPAGTKGVVWQWATGFGASILRVTGPADADLYRAYLQPGEASEPVPLDGVVSPSVGTLMLDYVKIGFAHIIPKGLDHILFVVGLFLFSVRWRPLLWQVTSFTLAHSVTLALGVLGLVTVSPAVVEPLIALSIVYVCVENLLSQRLHVWRPVLIFCFGLLHGLGFAGVLQEVGLDRGHFILGLLAFNLGIELGQLAVILCCFLLVGVWFRHKDWYRRRIVVPASAGIALVGTYWFVQRVFL